MTTTPPTSSARAASPNAIHVYIDETARGLADGRRLLGAGALFVTEPITQDVIDSALHALRDDVDRYPSSPRFKPSNEKRDARTLVRRYFHASDDSMNARSALATAIKNRVSGKFECSFAEATTRSDELEFRMHSMHSLLPALTERLPLTVTFEQRSGFSRMSGEAFVEYMNQGLDWSAYDLAMMRSFYPHIDVRVEPKREPGLQVVDMLLWGALQQHLEPTSHKARIPSWCGGFRWAHGAVTPIKGSPHINAKYFVNHNSPRLTDEHDDHRPYPVDFEVLDDGDNNALANTYCLIERIVRDAAVTALPAHVDHLRVALHRTVRRLRDPERVGPEQIIDLLRQFLRLFDTLPLYDDFEAADPRWLPLVRAKRMAGLCLRTDLLHGGATLDFFTMMRRRHVRSSPNAFGIVAAHTNLS